MQPNPNQQKAQKVSRLRSPLEIISSLPASLSGFFSLYYYYVISRRLDRFLWGNKIVCGGVDIKGWSFDVLRGGGRSKRGSIYYCRCTYGIYEESTKKWGVVGGWLGWKRKFGI